LILLRFLEYEFLKRSSCTIFARVAKPKRKARPTFSPFPPDQLLERVYAHQHRIVPLHRDIALLKVFLVDLVGVARAVREEERDEEGLSG